MPNEGEFPLIFRPSFRHERSVYFRNWPYAATGDGKATISTIISDAAGLAEGAEEKKLRYPGAKQRKSFIELSSQNLETYLNEVRSTRKGALENPIAIPVDKHSAAASYFIKGGVIGIEPKVGVGE